MQPQSNSQVADNVAPNHPHSQASLHLQRLKRVHYVSQIGAESQQIVEDDESSETQRLLQLICHEQEGVFQNTSCLLYEAPILDMVKFCPSDETSTLQKQLMEVLRKEHLSHSRVLSKLKKRYSLAANNDAIRRLHDLSAANSLTKVADPLTDFTASQFFSKVKDNQSIQAALRIVFDLAHQSELSPSTLPLFIQYFDIYLSNFSEQTLIDYGSKIIPIAITCYRLAAKYNENQEDLWKDKVKQSSHHSQKRDVCSHQLIYDTLTNYLLKTQIVARPQTQEQVQSSVEDIKNYVFQSEVQVLQTLDFQPKVAHGYDILTMILKIANPSFNFKSYIEKVQVICLKHMFRVESHLPFFRQSVLYLAVLKQVCLKSNCPEFFNDLKEFILGEKMLPSFAEVEHCFQIITQAEHQRELTQNISRINHLQIHTQTPLDAFKSRVNHPSSAKPKSSIYAGALDLAELKDQLQDSPVSLGVSVENQDTAVQGFDNQDSLSEQANKRSRLMSCADSCQDINSADSRASMKPSRQSKQIKKQTKATQKVGSRRALSRK